MFKLTVRAPDGTETNYSLGVDQGLIVGRDEACDMPLVSQRVSRRHARFYTTGNILHLEDLESQNGVFVGGSRITGKVEIRPGPAIEIGDFKIRVKREDLQAPENMYAGTMTGIDAMEGKTLKLPEAKGVIGREETADIPVVNDSVSRAHAEIRNGGIQGFFVTDLGSSNGTWLNGTKLPAKAERPLRPGDRVQFGDTAWLVVPKSAMETSATAKSARKSFMITMGVLILVVGGAAYFLLHSKSPVFDPGPRLPVDPVAPAWDRCQASINDQKWSDAQRSCGDAYDEEPFRERRAAVRQVKLELEVKDIYDDAMRIAELGRDREAVERFFAVDPKSSYFLPARAKVQLMARALMKTDNNACHEAFRQRRPPKALEACGNYLRYQCHNGIDKDALKIYDSARKAKTDMPFVCPAELAPWFKTGVAQEDDSKTFCTPKYTDKDICDAVIIYAHCAVNGKDLSRVTQVLHKAAKGTTKDLSERLNVDILAVQEHYTKGSRTADFDEMEREFKEALAKDAEVMQTGTESMFGKEMKEKLATHYEQIGSDAKSKDDLPAAFDAFRKGAAYRPKLSQAMDDLEKTAVEQLSKTPDCPTLRKILAYTRETSEPHKDADRRVHADSCPP